MADTPIPTALNVTFHGGRGPQDVAVDWGDGSEPFRRANVDRLGLAHQYLAPGAYLVTATAVDASGTKTTVERSVTVLPPPTQ